MSYDSLLIEECTVFRYPAGGAPDAYGTPTKAFVPVVVVGDKTGSGELPCRLMAVSGVELTIGAEVVIADYKLFLYDVEITEQDEVFVWVRDPLGVWDAGRMFEILLVKNVKDSIDGHHKECFLRIAR